jgi:hypothetical protein
VQVGPYSFVRFAIDPRQQTVDTTGTPVVVKQNLDKAIAAWKLQLTAAWDAFGEDATKSDASSTFETINPLLPPIAFHVPPVDCRF